ncbi:MAG TPA: transcription factor S [Candidatus Aenigmarchaeota archaeon]|nr:transcription factor S [Candidatus Aenigmarchaeota archaeon]
MKFCPKCEGIMMPKKEKNKVILVCRSCGYKMTSQTKGYNLKEKIKKGPEDDIIVMEKDISLETLPTIKIQCPKCGHMKAYWWVQQTRSADEAPTRFYQCCKCGYKWREYQ